MTSVTPPGPAAWPRRADRAATGLLLLIAVTLAALLLGGAIGVRLLVERSGSMRPAVAAGDLLISHRVASSGLRRGDIVTFVAALHPNIPTTHRIVALRRRGDTLLVTTRGDANSGSEQWSVRSSARVSRVAFIIPVAGRLAPTDGVRRSSRSRG